MSSVLHHITPQPFCFGVPYPLHSHLRTEWESSPMTALRPWSRLVKRGFLRRKAASCQRHGRDLLSESAIDAIVWCMTIIQNHWNHPFIEFYRWFFHYKPSNCHPTQFCWSVWCPCSLRNALTKYLNGGPKTFVKGWLGQIAAMIPSQSPKTSKDYKHL
jgi:hypothetical protein